MVEMSENKISLSWNQMKLYDDESVRKKLTVMDKWDILFDDSRNMNGAGGQEDIEGFLELGHVYSVQITVTRIERIEVK